MNVDGTLERAWPLKRHTQATLRSIHDVVPAKEAVIPAR